MIRGYLSAQLERDRDEGPERYLPLLWARCASCGELAEESCLCEACGALVCVRCAEEAP